MSVLLYVGNLPYSISEESLTQLFSQAGNVEEVRLPADRDTGRPRGFGFVEMATDEDAQNAIKKFDGHAVDGREIRVNIAEERTPRTGPSGRRGRR